MKHFFSGMMMALALVTALIVGVVALAESAAPNANELPSVEEAQPQTPQAQQPAADAAGDTALREAFDAYRAAKQSTRQEELEAELKGYVESGKLTQEQADLILNYYKEQQALRDGTCPGCGYQFQSGGKGGRMNGSRGMNGGKGGHMGGGRGMNGQSNFGQQLASGQQPSFGQQPTDGQQPAPGQQPAFGQGDGTAFAPDAQAMPDMSGDEGI